MAFNKIENTANPEAAFQKNQVHWLVDDIIMAAKADGVNLTVEQATHWWLTEGKGFREALTQTGNEMLRSVDWEGYASEYPVMPFDEKPRWFIVFIDSDFVRDSQFYNGESFADCIDIHDEEHEENWAEVHGPIMVWHGTANSAEAAIANAMQMYSASKNEFFAMEVFHEE